MANTFIRTLIIFILLIIVMRLMGKRQIGEMQPFEFVVTLIIADLACVPMADVSIPLTYGIVAVLTLFVLHQLFSFIEQLGYLPKKILSGKPSIVIDKNGVIIKELKKNNMGLDDLIESMRSNGYFSLDDLDYAIFESNGKLSALENPNKPNHQTALPLLIVDNGKLINKNVEKVGASKQKVLDFITKNNSSLKNTEVLTIDANGRAYIKTKNKKYKILNFYTEEALC